MYTKISMAYFKHNQNGVKSALAAVYTTLN